jgi:hypothetical protein
VYRLLFHCGNDIVLWGDCLLESFCRYRSCWFFDLPIKHVKAEHVCGIPLGLFILGLGCSNLIVYIYIYIYMQIPVVNVIAVL